MRIVSIIALMLLALHAPFWIFLICAAIYVLVVAAPYEVLVLAVCLDAAFSDSARPIWCAYTLLSGALIVAVALARPYLTFYTTHDF